MESSVGAHLALIEGGRILLVENDVFYCYRKNLDVIRRVIYPVTWVIVISSRNKKTPERESAPGP